MDLDDARGFIWGIPELRRPPLKILFFLLEIYLKIKENKEYSVEKIAEAIDRKRNSLYPFLSILEKRGYIEIINKTHGTGRPHTRVKLHEYMLRCLTFWGMQKQVWEYINNGKIDDYCDKLVEEKPQTTDSSTQ